MRQDGAIARGPLRVLHVVTDEDRSGLFTGLARRIDRKDFDLRFVSLGSPEPAFAERVADAAVPFHGLGARGRPGYVRAVARLASIARSARIDVLHAHVFDPTLVGVLAARLARVPVVVHTRHHSDYHTRMDRPVHVALDRAAALLSTRVVAVSAHTRDHLVRAERIPADRVVAIPNALDPERVSGITQEGLARARSELPRRAGVPTLLVPGRLHPEKGHPVLFEALARLRAWGLRPPVVLAGDGPFREPYRLRCVELGLGDQVRFLGHRPDVVTLMAAADVVVLPSSAEAFGLVAIEALAVGAPLIVSDAGALPELVRYGRDAAVFPSDDPAALAGLLSDVVQGSRTLPQPPPCTDVLARHGFEAWIRGHEDLYRALVREVAPDGTA